MPAHAAPPGPTGPRGFRVLLVDDNADSREMYSVLLQTDGHEVHEAEDGPTAALAAFRRGQRPTWPSSISACRGSTAMKWRGGFASMARAGTSPLIALTGYGFPEDRERSRMASDSIVTSSSRQRRRRSAGRSNAESLKSDV